MIKTCLTVFLTVMINSSILRVDEGEGEGVRVKVKSSGQRARHQVRVKVKGDEQRV